MSSPCAEPLGERPPWPRFVRFFGSHAQHLCLESPSKPTPSAFLARTSSGRGRSGRWRERSGSHRSLAKWWLMEQDFGDPNDDLAAESKCPVVVWKRHIIDVMN